MNTPNGPNIYLNQKQKLINSQKLSNPQDLKKPYVRIVEQPTSAGLRFRYKCEGRSAGSLLGCNSTNETKTFPTIEIMNYQGKAHIIVSCVTIKEPYKVHPHFLVGKDQYIENDKATGIISVHLSGDKEMRYQFESLGVQCVRRKDIVDSLDLRKKFQIDPFNEGYDHAKELSFNDLNAVRLCFQVYIYDNDNYKHPLDPVVSDIVYDKKTKPDLRIHDINPSHSSVLGLNDITLLCNCVCKESIIVRFYEEDLNGNLIWESHADFQPRDVHKSTAIKFKSPKYRLDNIQQKVKCFVQLLRQSDSETSLPKPFYYLPDEVYHPIIKSLEGGTNNSKSKDFISSNYLTTNLAINNLANNLGINSNLVNNFSIHNLQPKLNNTPAITFNDLKIPNHFKRKRLDEHQQDQQLTKRNYVLNGNQLSSGCLNSLINSSNKQIDNHLILNNLQTTSTISSLKQAQINSAYLNNLHQFNTVNCINLPNSTNNFTSNLSNPLNNNSFSTANSDLSTNNNQNLNSLDIRNRIFNLNQRSNIE